MPIETINNNISMALPVEIYYQHLQTINGVYFTNREIDIAACILQGRTAKRIAILLNISPKTVENHLRNIMLKITCYSKEKIIDFIEKSGKFNYIKYYYSSLVIKLAFEMEWKQVLSLVQAQRPINCTVVYHNLVNEKSKLLQQFLDHLKAINIQPACINIQDAIDMILSGIRLSRHMIYCVSTDLNEYIKKVDSTMASCLLQIENTILLLLDTVHDVERLLQPCHQIDLTSTQNYYFAIFSILKLFFPTIDFTDNINAFEKYCINLLASEIRMQHASVFLNASVSVQEMNKAIENYKNLAKIGEFQTDCDQKTGFLGAAVNHQTSNNSVKLAAYKIAANGANEFKMFLQLVADGEQELAEQILKQHPSFVLSSGDIVDLSKRLFTEITAFQYALWSLDWNMWSMLQTYMPNKYSYAQIETFHQKISQQHGKHAGIVDGPILSLILSLEKYIKLCKNETNSKEACEYWNHQIGEHQRMLPTHVVNEYCSKYWYAEHNVRNKILLTLGSVQRVRNVYINGKLEDWYSAYNNKLGQCFAYMRYSLEYPEGQDAFGLEMPLGEFGGRRLRHDINVLKNLHDVRTKQFFTFISQYI